MSSKRKSGFGVYLAMGVELTVSIVISSFLGAWVDSKLNLNGVSVLILIVVSLTIGFLRLFQLAKNDSDKQ